jgi:predicted ribosomally synthesized peptide with SipW-like signal peptide
MRFLCFVFLVLFLAAVGVFAYFNQQDVTLQVFNWTVTASVALVIGVAYLLGMLSGWTVYGMLRRSLREVSNYAQENLTTARR